MGSHIYGYTLQKLHFLFKPPQNSKAAKGFVPLIPVQNYPYFSELAGLMIERHHSGVHDLAFGLELILDGLVKRCCVDSVKAAHSSLSVDNLVRILASSTKARQALALYIVRPPVSLHKLLVDEGGTDTVIYHAPYSHYFKTATKRYSPPSSFLSRSSTIDPTRAAAARIPSKSAARRQKARRGDRRR